MAWRSSIHTPPVAHGGNPIPMGCRAGNMLYSSGIGGRDPQTGVEPPDVESRVANAFANMKRVLEVGGAKPGDVAHVTVTVNDQSVRPILNKHWVEWFPDENNRPARHTHIEGDQTVVLEIVCVIEGA